MSKVLDNFNDYTGYPAPRTVVYEDVSVWFNMRKYKYYEEIEPMRSFSYITFAFLIYWTTTRKNININLALEKTNDISKHYVDKQINYKNYFFWTKKYNEAIKQADKCSNSDDAFIIILDYYYMLRSKRLDEFVSEYKKEKEYRLVYNLDQYKENDLWLFKFIKSELHKWK